MAWKDRHKACWSRLLCRHVQFCCWQEGRHYRYRCQDCGAEWRWSGRRTGRLIGELRALTNPLPRQSSSLTRATVTKLATRIDPYQLSDFGAKWVAGRFMREGRRNVGTG